MKLKARPRGCQRDSQLLANSTSRAWRVQGTRHQETIREIRMLVFNCLDDWHASRHCSYSISLSHFYSPGSLRMILLLIYESIETCRWSVPLVLVQLLQATNVENCFAFVGAVLLGACFVDVSGYPVQFNSDPECGPDQDTNPKTNNCDIKKDTE